MSTPPANRLVIEGNCLATIKTHTDAKLQEGIKECTRLIESTTLSSGAVELAVALRDTMTKVLDARYAK